MLEALRLFKDLRSENLGSTDLELLQYVESELEEEFPEIKEGILLGVDPVEGHGNGRIDDRFRAAIMIARNKEEKYRVHNNSIALSRGNTSGYETPFRTDPHPYMIEKVRAWHDRMQNPEIPKAQKDPENPGFQAGRDLRSALLAQANAAKNGGNQTYSS